MDIVPQCKTASLDYYHYSAPQLHKCYNRFCYFINAFISGVFINIILYCTS